MSDNSKESSKDSPVSALRLKTEQAITALLENIINGVSAEDALKNAHAASTLTSVLNYALDCECDCDNM